MNDQLVDRGVNQICDDVVSQYYKSLNNLILNLLTNKEAKTNEELLMEFLPLEDGK